MRLVNSPFGRLLAVSQQRMILKMDKCMKYEPIPEMTRAEIEESLRSSDERRQTMALLSAAWFQPDHQWVETCCIKWLCSESMQLRYVALVCLGHLARIHRRLRISEISPLLELVEQDERLAGEVDYLRIELSMFKPENYVL